MSDKLQFVDGLAIVRTVGKIIGQGEKSESTDIDKLKLIGQ